MTKATQNQSLVDIIAAVSPQAKTAMSKKAATAIETRMEFENRERPGNTSIQTKLKTVKGKLTEIGAVGVMCAIKLDPEVINRSVTDGRRFNIYAADKLADLIQGLNTGTFRNAINIAVMKSLFQFRAAGVPFTGLAAMASASDKVKVESGMSKILVRHSVSAATAPTQTSSTMNAMVAVGAVKNVGTAKFPIWEIVDGPVAERMQEIAQAA